MEGLGGLSGAFGASRERVFFIDNLLVRIHFIIVMIRWTGLAPFGASSSLLSLQVLEGP